VTNVSLALGVVKVIVGRASGTSKNKSVAAEPAEPRTHAECPQSRVGLFVSNKLSFGTDAQNANVRHLERQFKKKEFQYATLRTIRRGVAFRVSPRAPRVRGNAFGSCEYRACPDSC
jgi:hypothetical protein